MAQKTTRELLLELGYYQITPDRRLSGSTVIAAFQKRFTDEKGIKYFITVLEHDFRGLTCDPAVDNYAFEFTMQFIAVATGRPVNINLFAGWQVEDVEDHDCASCIQK